MQRETSCSCLYLVDDCIDFFVRWISNKSKPRERVVFVVAEDILKRSAAIPTDLPHLIVGQEHDVRPAVHVGDRLERSGNASPRPTNANHCVVSGRIVQNRVATPLWKERSVPEGHQVSASYTHCVQHTTAFETIHRVAKKPNGLN